MHRRDNAGKCPGALAVLVKRESGQYPTPRVFPVIRLTSLLSPISYLLFLTFSPLFAAYGLYPRKGVSRIRLPRKDRLYGDRCFGLCWFAA